MGKKKKKKNYFPHVASLIGKTLIHFLFPQNKKLNNKKTYINILKVMFKSKIFIWRLPGLLIVVLGTGSKDQSTNILNDTKLTTWFSFYCINHSCQEGILYYNKAKANSLASELKTQTESDIAMLWQSNNNISKTKQC